MKKICICLLSALFCAFPLFALSGSEAEDIALRYAGVSRQNARITETKKEIDDGWSIDSVKFWSGAIEYEVKIDDISQEIVKYSFEMHRGYAVQQQQPPVQQQATASAAITQDQAILIALNDARVNKTQASRVSCRYDWEDGREVWEVSFYVNWRQYEYKIESTTGQIIEKDLD